MSRWFNGILGFPDHPCQEAMKGRAAANFRCVVYICMLPQDGISYEQLGKKQQALREMRLTSHWPRGAKLFAKMPRTHGAKLETVQPLPPPVLTDLGRLLSGCNIDEEILEDEEIVE